MNQPDNCPECGFLHGHAGSCSVAWDFTLRIARKIAEAYAQNCPKRQVEGLIREVIKVRFVPDQDICGPIDAIGSEIAHLRVEFGQKDEK